MANFGALSSLGLGSGVLNYDVIEKLKEADKAAMINPIDKKYDLTKQKESDLSNITMLTSSLKTSILDLANGTFYSKRQASVIGDDVSVKVNDGVDPQEISMTVNQLAQRDVWESKGFSDTESAVTDKDTTMTLSIDGTDYTIDVKAGTTLEKLRDQINEATDGKIEASILDTGGDTPYSLILKSSDTGATQAITATFDDGDDSTDDDDFLNLTNVQTAQDAEFIYNGVTVTRDTNTVDDLLVGVTFELLKADSSATNTIDISQDEQGIADTMQTFVDTYNSWIQAMNDATKFDEEAGTAGIFQGESAIRQLKTDVARALFGSTPTGEGVGTYGISVNEDGLISFDRSTFIDALENDGESLMKTFSDENTGVFTRLNQVLGDAIDPINGSLSLLDQQYKRDEDRLQEERDRNLEILDARYNTMAMRFAMYDEMIGQMNNDFMALQSMIDAMTKNKD